MMKRVAPRLRLRAPSHINLSVLGVERPLADLGPPSLASHVDLDLGPGIGDVASDVPHPDADLERRGHRPAGRDADLLLAGEDPVALPGDSGAGDHERLQQLLRALVADPPACLRADETSVL